MRMQARSKVIEVQPEEYDALKRPLKTKRLYDLLKEQGESSDFTTDDAEEFIKHFSFDRDKPPTREELELVRGIMPPNDQLREGLGDKRTVYGEY
jgi:hypothetical protein